MVSSAGRWEFVSRRFAAPRADQIRQQRPVGQLQRLQRAEIVGPRGDHLFAIGAAQRAHQADRRSPAPRGAARHPRLPKSAAAFFGAVSVTRHSASMNCSAVIRRASGPRKAKSWPPCGSRRLDTARLIDLRSGDQPQHVLHVVVGVDQLGRQVIEQFVAPRPRLHRVDRMDDAAAQQPMPKPIHHRAGQSPIAGIRDQAGQAAASARRAAWPRRSCPIPETRRTRRRSGPSAGRSDESPAAPRP